jgi:intraflagellar transport protein 56
MASCFFLLKNFEDVNIYLNSIKTYMYGSADTYRCREGSRQASMWAWLAV